MTDTNLDRPMGAFLGLAIGDAMGAPVEFCPPGSFPPVIGYRSGGPFNLRAGQWTDDTAMAVCLAESLLACHGSDPADQARRWRAWMDSPACFDVGIGTAAALRGADNSDSMGNGCLMRLAPIPIYFRREPMAAHVAAEKSCLVTHGHLEAGIATCRMTSLLMQAFLGVDKQSLLAGEHIPEHPVAGGTAPVALAAALWAFATTDSFRDCILAAVNLGDDADTVGAIAGQLAGAFYGLEAIPADWLRGLDELQRLHGLALKLCRP
jgi:ADP-ribosyl-[dinitrogen reductase] hydrolase